MKKRIRARIKKQRVSFLVGENMWREFKWLCDERGRTPSEQIRTLIHDMIIRDGKPKQTDQPAKP